jgi:hypothetical protein
MAHVAYTAIVLTEEDRDCLLVGLKELWQAFVKKGYTIVKEDGIPICHHMTLNLGKASDDVKPFLGEKVLITLTSFGFTDKAVALKASIWTPDVPCHNVVPHVTMAIHKGNGGKPKDSNQIKQWIKLTRSVCVEGVVEEVLA